MLELGPRLLQHGLAVTVGVLACASVAAAGRNLSFEEPGDAAAPPGWDLRGLGTAVTADAAVARHGHSSLRVELDAGRRGGVRLTQRVPISGSAGLGFEPGVAAGGAVPTSTTSPEQALLGSRVRISAYVRVETPDSTRASLWVRVDGGDALLYVDRGREQLVDAPGWQRLTIEAPLAAHAEQLTFGASLEGRGRAWLDDFRVEVYDTASELPPAARVATRYVERALAIMRANSLMRARVDWSRLAAATHAQARGAHAPADTYLALQFALTSLGDRHSYFMPPERMRQLERAPVSNARTGRPPVDAQSRPLGERVGYVRMPGYGGGSQADQAAFAGDLQDRIEVLDAPARCGWVVDLRGNSGGNLWPMLAGLGPLLGDGDVGAAVHPNGARRPIAYTDGKASLDGHVQLRVRRAAYRPARPSAPVAVLIDDDTASSGEIIAMFVNARAHTRSFGAPTAGVATATRTFVLSDGAALILTVAATSDKHGRTADGPIAPDVAIENGRASGGATADAVLGAALDWLAGDYGCR